MRVPCRTTNFNVPHGVERVIARLEQRGRVIVRNEALLRFRTRDHKLIRSCIRAECSDSFLRFARCGFDRHGRPQLKLATPLIVPVRLGKVN